MKNLVIWPWTVRAVVFWPRRAACSVLVPRLGIEPRSGSEGKRRRKWQLTPVFLPGKFHGRRSLVGYSPWDRKESDTTEQLHSHSLVVKALSPNQWTALEFPFVFLVCVFQERKKKKKKKKKRKKRHMSRISLQGLHGLSEVHLQKSAGGSRYRHPLPNVS